MYLEQILPLYYMGNLSVILVRQDSFQRGICLHFLTPKRFLGFSKMRIFKNHGGYQTAFNCLHDKSVNCFPALLVNLFSWCNFILRDYIFRWDVSITSFASTRTNKLRKKVLRKRMQVSRRKSKSVWVVHGRDDIFRKNLQIIEQLFTDDYHQSKNQLLYCVISKIRDCYGWQQMRFVCINALLQNS